MSGSTTVTVADILELRAEGLTEEEIWSLLCQAVQTLQDLFLSDDKIDKKVVPLVTPNTLGISSRGRVIITFINGIENHQKSYLAPEYVNLARRNFTSLDWEKMWVYSLGRTLLFALKSAAQRESASVLKFMTANDPTCRASLMSLLNIISEHYKTNLPLKPFSHLVTEMYKEVFGSPPQCLLSLNTPRVKVDAGRITKTNSFSESPNSEKKIFSRFGCGKKSSEKGCPVRRNPVQRAPSRLYRGPAVAEPGRRVLPSACVGPEFVVRGMRPPKVVHVGDVKASHRKTLTVILLTGQRIRVTCDPHAITCGKLYEILVEVEEIEDNFIFGLASMIKGDFVFIPSEMKLHKVAPPDWKEGKRGRGANDCNFFLYLRVKFFLPSLRGLKNKNTKHLMYLQLRRSLLEQQIKCELEELLTFGGLALQAEFGNFDEEEHGISSYFLLEHYIPEELIDDRLELETRLQEYHKSRTGLDPNVAEEIFVAQAQRLPEYGSHHYTAVWERKNVSIPMWVTVNLEGVYLYEKKNNVLDRRIHEAFVWKNMQGFSCNENYFRLAPQDILGGKVACYKLRMDCKKSFFFFRLASFHHQFFSKLRIELSSLHSLSQEFGIGCKKNTKNNFYLERKTIRPEVWNKREEDNNKTSTPRENLEKRQNKENENPPGNRGEKRVGVKMGISALSLPGSGRFSFSDVSTNSLDAFVIDSSMRSSDEKFTYDFHESIPSKLASKWEEVSCVEERILRKVRLTKDKYGSFGLEIVEGNNGGLFIENVLKRSGTDEIDSVQRGDQVLSVNGICLLNLNYSDALNVLRTTGNEIEILVSQSCGRERPQQQPIEHEYLKNIRNMLGPQRKLDHFRCGVSGKGLPCVIVRKPQMEEDPSSLSDIIFLLERN